MVDNQYAQIAQALREVATRLDTLSTLDLPHRCFVSMDIQPGGNGEDASRIHAVDTVATALLGVAGISRQLYGGTWHHGAHADLGPIHIGVYDEIDSPVHRALTEEITRLRSQLDAPSTPAVR